MLCSVEMKSKLYHIGLVLATNVKPYLLFRNNRKIIKINAVYIYDSNIRSTMNRVCERYSYLISTQTRNKMPYDE